MIIPHTSARKNILRILETTFRTRQPPLQSYFQSTSNRLTLFSSLPSNIRPSPPTCAFRSFSSSSTSSSSSSSSLSSSSQAPSRPPLRDPYLLVYEGPIVNDINNAKAIFLGVSAAIALLLGYAFEVQRVGIPYGQRRSIATQFSAGGLVDGRWALAAVGFCYLVLTAFFFFLLRRYVTRLYLYRDGAGGGAQTSSPPETARFLALREPLLPTNDKVKLEFGLGDVKGRSSVGPYLYDKAFVNAVIAGKPVFIDPNGFKSLRDDEDALSWSKVAELRRLIKAEA